jgi:membrane protein DedA with SNARE-associated domain
VFDEFTHFVKDASGWAYAVLFLLAVIDAVFPLVPSETSVITAGVVAASGNLTLALVIVAAAAGAFVGDNGAYMLGRRFGVRARQRFATSDRARKRAEWAERQLTERGGQLIGVGRFIPGGRTAVTLAAGTLHYPWRRFIGFDAAAALAWALYASLLGYFGGHAFENSALKGLLLALGIAFVGVAVTELVLRYLRRRKSRGRSQAQSG